MKINELKGVTLDAGEQIVCDTHVSGVVKKGGEVICTIPMMKYRLVVDVGGVDVAQVVERFKAANLTVKSQSWLKNRAISGGVAEVKKLLGDKLTKVEATEKNPVSHWVGGELRVTWEQLFPTERAKLSAEQRVEQSLGAMTQEQKLALLLKLQAQLGV